MEKMNGSVLYESSNGVGKLSNGCNGHHADTNNNHSLVNGKAVTMKGGTHASNKIDSSSWSKAYCVLGAQWGDEGKGKIVDLLAMEMDVVCRCAVSYTHFIVYFFLTNFLFY